MKLIITLVIALIIVAGAAHWWQSNLLTEETDREVTADALKTIPDDKSPLPSTIASNRDFDPAGFTFQDKLEDGSIGPEMILIPAGTYQMGSPSDEPERHQNEKQHSITIAKPFAVSKYEVTFAQYDSFAEFTQREKPFDQDWGRGDRPVLNISWLDALAYAEWLSQQTGRPYRLLTEAEWEYVARAGTTTTYWWGNALPDNLAICKDCNNQWEKREPAPVGQLPANSFGVHDILGNVWEWTCSTYQENYLGAELHCAANDDDSLKSIRGGSYLNHASMVRAAVRDTFSPADSNELVGFRLARDL